MTAYRWLVGVALALAASSALSAPNGCGLPEITGSRELHEVLSLRAIELVRRAANANDRPTALVARSASFSLGGGDVGRPLGSGVAGARELARTMHADTYRFLGWDYMDIPAEPCGAHKVEVEFIDTQGRSLSRVEFAFEAGRVVSASGWQRSFVSGVIEKAADR